MGHHDDDDNGHGHVEGLDESEHITEEDIVVLVDDEGGEHRYVLLAMLEVEGVDYAVLGPEDQLTDPTREEVDLSFFEVISEGEQERLEPVEDPARFAAVQAATAELLGLDEDDGGDDFM